MKKLFLSAIAFISFTFAAQAQSAEKGDFNIGITAGAGYANVSFEDKLRDQEGVANI